MSDKSDCFTSGSWATVPLLKGVLGGIDEVDVQIAVLQFNWVI